MPGIRALFPFLFGSEPAAETQSAASVVLSGPSPPRDSIAVLLTYAGQTVDLVAEGLVDPETVRDSDCDHGCESAEFSVVGRPHIPSHHLLVEGADLAIVRNGRTSFEGDIVRLSTTDSPHKVECAGIWDKAGRRNDFRKGFVERRFDRWIVPAEGAIQTTWQHRKVEADFDSEGQVLLMVSKGTYTGVYDSYAAAALWILDGLDPTAEITRFVGDLNISADAQWSQELGLLLRGELYGSGANDPGASHVHLVTSTGTTAVDSSAGSGQGYRCAILYLQSYGGYQAGQDEVVQLRNYAAYINRSVAPRVDQALLEILKPSDDSLATASVTETIGSALGSTVMIDGPTTRTAAASDEIAPLATGPVLMGYWPTKTVHILPRPSAPTSAFDHIVITDEDLTSPNAWSVAPNREVQLDAVCGSYQLQSTCYDGATPSGMAKQVYYPSAYSRGGASGDAASRIAHIGLGQCTDAEATQAVQQCYAYYASLATGGFSLEADHLRALPGRAGRAAVRTIGGALMDIWALHSWMWVTKADAIDESERGPFMLNRCERLGTTGVSISCDEASYYNPPSFEHPALKGQYVPGRVAQKGSHRGLFVDWWRRTHRGQDLPRAHPKWKRWEEETPETEGYYR